MRQELPHYEALWNSFIGHSGNGWPCSIIGLRPEKEQARKKLYQAHYSAAIGCYQIDEAIKDIETNLGEVKDIASFMREHRHLHCLMGWIGQVRDMYKQMDEALNLGGAAINPLQDFYALRSHVMHGPRMPVRIIDGFIKIPKVAKQNKTAKEWDDKSYWDDFADAEFVFIADFCAETREDFFKLVREMHAKIYSSACEFFEGKRIQEPIVPQTSITSFSTITPAISAWTPPSGSKNG